MTSAKLMSDHKTASSDEQLSVYSSKYRDGVETN